MLEDGDTLVIASAAPKPETAIAAEFRSPCEADSSFGHNGATQLAVPGRNVTISAVLPAADGGAFVAGSTDPINGRWLVGKITADGQPDTAFGLRGWAQLPWRGSVTAMATRPSGDLVIGGGGTENGSSFVAEMTSQGRLARPFGVLGRAPMPNWHDGGIQRISVEPNGDVLILIGGGNMGCWGVTAVTLRPSGLREPTFMGRFTRAMRHADRSTQCFSPVFVGDIDTGPTGFLLVGTSQRHCVYNSCTEHPQQRPDPSQRVSEIAFDYNGDLNTAFATNAVASISGPMAVQASVLPLTDGSLLLADSPATSLSSRHARTDLLVYHLTSGGQLDTGYADHGVATIRLPYENRFATYTVSLPVSNGRQTAIASSGAAGDTVILIPVP